MAATGAFAVESVNGAPLERLDRIFDEAALVQGVGMDRHLDVQLVRYVEAGADRRGGGAPILMQLQSHHAGEHLLAQRLVRGAVSLAEKSEVHWELVRRFEHAVNVPSSRGARGGVSAVRRAGASTDHG